MVAGVSISAVLTYLEFSRFTSAKGASLSRLSDDINGQRQAMESAISELKFLNRNESIIAFAGFHTPIERSVLFVDWVSHRSSADSIRVTLKDGRSITCPFTNIYFDSNVYYHHEILLDEFGVADGSEIRHVELTHDGESISDSIPPVEWIYP